MIIKRRDNQTENTVQIDIAANTMGDAADNGVVQNVPSEDELAAEEAPAPAAQQRAARRDVYTANANRTGTPKRARAVPETRRLLSTKVFWLIAVLCGIAIAVCSGRTIFFSDGPVIMGDELGYWGNAAVLAGQDWQSIMSLLPFYSFGYSLLLVPMYWLGLPMAVMYRVALALNVVFLLLAFALAYRCLRKLFASLSPIPALLVACATTLYTYNTTNAQLGWDECLLYLLYWAMLWLVLNLLEKPGIKGAALLAVCGGYMYMVHMRTVGVVIALCMTVLLFWAAKRLSWKQVLVFFAVFAGMIALQNVGKLYLESAAYTGGGLNGMNDYGSQLGKIRVLFSSWEDFVRLLQSLCGKMFYVGVATIMLGFVSLGLLFKDFFIAMGQWAKSKFRKFDPRKLPSMFLLLSFGGTYLINAIAMSDVDRMDLPIYGRYMEFAFGPIIAIGLALLVLGRVGIGQALGCGGVLLIFSAVTNTSLISMQSNEVDGFVYTNICTLQRIVERMDAVDNLSYFLAIIACVVFFMMWGMQYACGRFLVVESGSARRLRFYKIARPLLRALLPIVLAAAAWVWCGWTTGPFTLTKYTVTALMQQTQTLLDEHGSAPQRVVWVRGGEDEARPIVWPAHMQLRWQGTRVESISVGEFESEALDPEALYVAVEGDSAANSVAERCVAAVFGNYFTVYTVPGSAWEQAQQGMPISLSTDKSLMLYVEEQDGASRVIRNLTANIETAEDADGITRVTVPVEVTSDGSESTVLRSAELNLPAGNYEFTFTLTLENAVSGTLGEIDLSDSQGNRLKTFELDSDDFRQGVRTSVTLTLSTMLDQRIDGMNFVLFAKSGVYITLHEAVYARVGEATEVIAAGSSEMNMLDRLLYLDYEKHPLYVLPRDSQLSRASVADLQAAFGDRKVILGQNLHTLLETPGILLIPTDRQSVIYSLLGEYTIAEKLGNYTLLLPTDSTAYSEFIGHGGIPMSDGYEVQLRYYSDSDTSDAGTVTATPPAGRYRLLMQPSFSNQLTGQFGVMDLLLDGVLYARNQLDKGEDMDSTFYMPLVLELDGTQEITIEVRSNTNASLSNLNVSLRLLPDGAVTYGDPV